MFKKPPLLILSFLLLYFTGPASGSSLNVPEGDTHTVTGSESYDSFYIAGTLIIESTGSLTVGSESTLDGPGAQITINGGSIQINNRFNIGQGSDGYITLNGGTFTCTGTFKFPDDPGGVHRIYLNDGVMHSHDIEQKHDRDAVFYLADGILRLDEITGGDRDPYIWKDNGDLLPAEGYDDIIIEDKGSYTEVRAVKSVPTVEFESDQSGDFESVSPVTLGVSLSKASPNTITVSYAVTGGTAEGGGTDYTITPSPLTFYPDEKNKSINIIISDDEIDEDDETIEVTLSGASGGAELGDITQHTYTIIDPRPKVSFLSNISSGPENITPAYIEVGLSWPIDEIVTVDYSVTGGTATGAGVDYTLFGDGTLSFDPCEITGYITIDIVDDPCEAIPETIELTLSSPTSNARLDDYTQHIFTIMEQDPLLEGAYYYRADSDPDARVAVHPDVMIRLGEGNDKLIFRRDRGFLPVWYSESSGETNLPEIVSRNGCETTVNAYSRVEIIETCPARAIVHWRYATDCDRTEIEITSWVDEYFTVYPDSVCIRTINNSEGTTLAQWQNPANSIVNNLKLEPDGVATPPSLWDNLPDLSLTGSSINDYNDLGFNQSRRCYILECVQNGLPEDLNFTLDTIGGKFIRNPVIVVKNWGEAGVNLSVDGQTYRNYQSGYEPHMFGTNLVLWTSLQSSDSVDFSISLRGSGPEVNRAQPPDYGYDFYADVPPLPMGSLDPGPFGAYYTQLQFNNRFDEQWRVGDEADVVVQFDDNAHRFVFWRGTNYQPHLAGDTSETPYSCWYGTQFIERRGEDWGLPRYLEPMSDWQCRYSHVRIISSNPARAIVQWRYSPCHLDYRTNATDTDPWGDWANEYYTIYPDGISVRRVTAWSRDTGGADMESPHIEFHEAIPVTNPGTVPEDNIHWNALSATDYIGNKKDWQAYDVDGGAMTNLDQITNKPIMVVRMKGSTIPITVVEGSSVVHDPVSQDNCRPFNQYDDWPAWPDGDRSFKAPPGLDWLWDEDPGTHCYRYFWEMYPSHCSILHLKWQDYEHLEDVKRTKIMLFGMYDAAEAANVNNLIPLARSWEYAPSLTITSIGYSGGNYDKTQRAYHISRDSDEAGELEFTVNGSSNSPIYNPCFIIENWWGDENATVSVDGQTIEQGPDFRQGIEKSSDGTSSLVVWLRTEASSAIDFTISRDFVNPADFDNDGDVDMNDLSILMLHWLENGLGDYQLLEGDLNGDDMVNFDDFALFCSYW